MAKNEMQDSLELTIFAKRRTKKDGQTFFNYITTLTRKDGTTMTVGVRFRQECGKPKGEDCPMVIRVPRKNANLSTMEYPDPETGEAMEAKRLWVSKWEFVGAYVDTTLDEYI